MTTFLRFLEGQRPRYGALEGQTVYPLVAGTPFGPFRQGREGRALSEVRLLPPCQPSKIIGMAVNYPTHMRDGARHMGSEVAVGEPQAFLKATSSLVGPDDDIVLPPGAGPVHYEGEMVVVMGRRCQRVTPEKALDYVLGVTCGNDVSAREWQRNDKQWWRAKGSDTFAPLGPWIVTGLDPRDLGLELRLNGQTRQQARTSELIHGVPDIISFISRYVTLEPGDVIYTGTPGTTDEMRAGDVVEVEVEGVGVLRNRVRGG
ncbi:MAG: fumarylacetoacetate hydrolase family protein [Dehalococcoidia bacterium]|nr:fumarylacetoacetate hydrolase family protein [Dehalococcoidia bacterium]